MEDTAMDQANRDYYNNMPTKRLRIVWEADVEWREDQPDYAFDVARLAEPSDTVRVRNPECVLAEVLDD